MARRVLSYAHSPHGSANDSVKTSGTAADHTDDRAGLPLVGFIRNPKSHRNKGSVQHDVEHARIITVEPQTRTELENALADLADKGIGMLAISGGDGTIRDVLTRGGPLFGDNWPDIIILPQGKTNALALDLGIAEQRNLRDALVSAREGRFVTRRPLVITPENEDQRTRLGFFLGVGAFNIAIDAGQVAHRYGAFQSFAVGITAAFGVFQVLCGMGKSPWRSLSKMHITDCTTGEQLPHSGVCPEDSRYIGGITTLSLFPPGIRPFSKMVCDGHINYFLIDAPHRRVAAIAPFAAVGKQHPMFEKLGMHRGSSNELLLDLKDPLILDGERYPAGRYRITAGPAIRFVI